MELRAAIYGIGIGCGLMLGFFRRGLYEDFVWWLVFNRPKNRGKFEKMAAKAKEEIDAGLSTPLQLEDFDVAIKRLVDGYGEPPVWCWFTGKWGNCPACRQRVKKDAATSANRR